MRQLNSQTSFKMLEETDSTACMEAIAGKHTC